VMGVVKVQINAGKIDTDAIIAIMTNANAVLKEAKKSKRKRNLKVSNVIEVIC